MTTDSEGAFQQLAQNTLAATTEASVELADLFGQNAKNNVPQIGELEPVVDQLIEIVFATQPMEQARLAIELKEISKVFAKQIERAISLVENTSADSAVAKGKAQKLAFDFLRRLPHLRTILWTDLQAAYHGDPSCRNIEEVVLCFPGLFAVAVHRFAHELYRLQVPLIPRMLAERAHCETGIDIHPGAIVGDHFFVDHGTGVVIGETSQIGDNVKIYQGVTLGAVSFQRDETGNIIRGLKRHPTVENNVVIYANATILGGLTVIGHDCVIGSNVWITKSVEPNTTVVMERPKLRMRNQGGEKFEDGEVNFSI
jgi:serine O-acetyltransferase